MRPATERVRSARLGLGLLAALAALLPALAGCAKSDDPAFYVERLGSENEETQRRAVEDLLLMHKQAMPLIWEAVKSPNRNLRIGCADFLSRVRRMESLTAVGELVEDSDNEVRLAAIEAVAKLSQVWKSKSVELLARGFEGTDPACITMAGDGLRDMEFEEATDYLQGQFDSGAGVQAVYAGKLLFEIDGKLEFLRPIMDGLVSGQADVAAAAQANAKALADRIVVPLVAYVRTEQHTAPARQTLQEIRDALREELDIILDSQRAQEVLMALGAIGDQESVERLKADLHDTKLESTWRVAAARAMALAAESNAAQAVQVKSDLQEVIDEEEDNRIRIGAAIALCELKEVGGVEFLLDMLDKFEEDITEENISEERVDDLTALRIGAQEALAETGEFAAPYLVKRLEGKPSPTIMWAAAKTLGEVGDVKAIPFLGEYLITKTPAGPGMALDEEGLLSGQLKDAEGKPTGPAADADWSKVTEDEAVAIRAQFEVFEFPHYVRWTAALALGRIGGTRARELLHQGEKAEVDLLERLARCKEQPGYFKRAPVLDGFARTHEDVLFYIRRALEDV